MRSIFEFTDYRSYIEAASRSKSPNRGEKSKLARAMGVQLSYLSLVFKHKAHLSLEQAEPLNRYFGHGERESRFFMALIQRDRASTESLRTFFDRQLHSMRKEETDLAKRIENKSEVELVDQHTYYSSWIYSAIHIATFLQGQTNESLSTMLRIPLETVQAAVAFLMKSGMLEKDGMKIKPSQRFIHLSKDSPLIGPHHINWRMRSIQQLQEDPRKGFFYSGVLCVSESDFQKLLNQHVNHVQSTLKTVQASKEEKLAQFSVDFFAL